MDPPSGDPPCIDTPIIHPVAGRQHGGAGPRPEGRGPQGKGSPRGGREDPSSPPSASAGLHTIGGEPPGGCSFTFPVGARLAPRSPSFLADFVPVGSTPDRPLFVPPVGADDALHVLEGRRLSGSHQRVQHVMGLHAGLPLSSHSPPQEGCEEAGVVKGSLSPCHSVLGGPDLFRQSPGASSAG
jgi:hypothetical protein